MRSLSLKTVALLFLISGLATNAAAQQEREHINARSATDSTVPPFSGAILAGNTLYLSGTIGLESNQQVPSTPEAEARLVLDNVRSTLAAAGMSMDDLVSVQVFCSDVSHYDAFNAVYRTYFEGDFPARAFIGAGTLLFNARFEVQGIAVRR
jgi:2-iminobutanoate/2-iminopropanoate deaminase